VIFFIDVALYIFVGVKRVVDLCAAPGGWTEVLSERLSQVNDRNRSNSSGSDTKSDDNGSGALIIAVDLQSMNALPGVHVIKGDITRQQTLDDILTKSGGEKIDLVVCDGAHDVTGLHDMDHYLQAQLLFAVISPLFSFGLLVHNDLNLSTHDDMR
jgi:tRNA (cytidine32/guanosine34-2'-O)-methyltransferase